MPQSTLDDYTLPKKVGVNQIAYSSAWQQYQNAMPHHFTTKELFDELAHHGISAIRLWLTVPFWDCVEHPTQPDYYKCNELWDNYAPRFEDMREVWGHPQIDTMVVVLTDPRHTYTNVGCDGKERLTFLSDYTVLEDFAHFMFRNFGHLDKTIIIGNRESDNEWRSFSSGCDETKMMYHPEWDDCLAEKTAEECVEELSWDHYNYVLYEANNRHRIIQEVREMYPDANLKLRTAMAISIYDDHNPRYLGRMMLREIPNMEYQPDYISLSHWRGAKISLTESIKIVRRITRYPVERLLVEQIGANNKNPTYQYEVITQKTREAWNNGINLVLVWIWKTTWPSAETSDKGMWYQLCPGGPHCGWGDPTSGLGAIYELNAEAQGGAR